MDERKKMVYDAINKIPKPLKDVFAKSQKSNLPTDFSTVEEAYAYEKGKISGIKKLLPSGQPFLEIVKKEKKYETSESESVVFPQECLDLMNLKTDILPDQDILNSLLKLEDTPIPTIIEENKIAHDKPSPDYSMQISLSLHEKGIERLDCSVEDSDHIVVLKCSADKMSRVEDAYENHLESGFCDLGNGTNNKKKKNASETNLFEMLEIGKENELRKFKSIHQAVASNPKHSITKQHVTFNENQANDVNDNIVITEVIKNRAIHEEGFDKEEVNIHSSLTTNVTQIDYEQIKIKNRLRAREVDKNNTVTKKNQKSISNENFRVSWGNHQKGEGKSDLRQADDDEKTNHDQINKNRKTVCEIKCQENTDQEKKKELEKRARKEKYSHEKYLSLKRPGGVLTCRLCNDMSEAIKPMQIINVGYFEKYVRSGDEADYLDDKVNKTYICLSGTHLKYVNKIWKPVDNSKLKTEYDIDYIGITLKEECYKQYAIGNNITCLFIPSCRNRHSKWLVKQTPVSYTRTDKSEGRNHFKLIDDCFNKNPVLVDCDQVQLKSEKILDNDCYVSQETRSKLLRVNKVSAPVKFTFGTTNITTKTIKENIAWNIIHFRKRTTDDYHGKLREVLTDSFKRVYITPLHCIICQIVKLIDKRVRYSQELVADDSEYSRIGWLIKNNLCTCFVNLFNLGLRSKSKLASLFGKIAPFSVWSIVKDFTQTYDSENFHQEKYIFASIDNNSNLPTSDMKFRYYICELLNRSRENKMQLLVLWFHLFILQKAKLKKYYKPNSFWRLKSSWEFDEFYIENIITPLRRLQNSPFKLHLNFEYRYLKNKVHLNQGTDQEFIYLFE